ncbi:tetratricopeptide repeat protein [Myxococcota bacterium]|nr:tetratricopeptide repeat protein [Myxococcota bacterium]
MSYLDLQRDLPVFVAQPFRQAADASEGWEEGASLLYGAWRLLRLLGMAVREDEARDLPEDLPRLAHELDLRSGEDDLAREMASRLGEEPVREAREELALVAAKFLDMQVLPSREDRESRALASRIAGILAPLVRACAGLEVRTSAGGRTFAWVGPEGSLVAPEPGPEGTVLVWRETGAVRRLAPSLREERRPRPMVPFPGPGKGGTLERDDGHLVEADGHAGVLGRLTAGRALGRLVAWHLPPDDDPLAAARTLADAGLPEAAGELLVLQLIHRMGERSQGILKAVLEFLHGHEQAETAAGVEIALRRELESEEARHRGAGDTAELARTLLARQELEKGPARVRVLWELADLMRDGQGDPSGEADCLLSALREQPDAENLGDRLCEAAVRAGKAGEIAGEVRRIARRPAGSSTRGSLLRLAARLFRADGRLPDALDTLSEALESAPDHLDWMEEAVAWASEARDPDRVIEAIRRRVGAARGGEDQARWIERLARALEDAGRVEEALGEHERVFLWDPSSGDRFALLANRYRKAGDLEGLRKFCDDTLVRAVEPAVQALALRTRGELLAQAGRDREALRDLNRAVALGLEDEACRDLLEHLAERLEDWDRLLTLLHRKTGGPDAGKAWLRMAEIAWIRKRDPETALGLLQEARSRLPGDPAIEKSLQELHEALGMWGEVARDLARQAEAAGPAEVDLWVRLADVQAQRLGRMDLARESLQRAARAASGDRARSIALRLAEIARDGRERVAEWEALEQAARFAPTPEEQADHWVDLARRALEPPSPDLGLARRALQEAVTANPLHREAVERLARLHLEEGKPESALALADPLIRKAVESRDGDLERRLSRLAGEAARKMGATGVAEERLRRVLELDPEDQGTRLALARVLAGSGKDAEAIPLLEEVLRMPAPPAGERVEDLHLLLARCSARAGDAARAVAEFEANWKVRGAPPDLLREMIAAAEKAGDWRRMAEWLVPFIESEPPGVKRFNAQIRLGDLYRDALQAPLEALRWYRAAAAEGVSTKAALHKALEAAVAAGEFQEAKGILLELVGEEQDVLKKAQFHYAAALLARDNLGDPDLTREHLWKAVDLNPDMTEAVEALEHLLLGASDFEGLSRLHQALVRHTRLTGQEDRLLQSLRRLASIQIEQLHNLPLAAETLRQVLEAAPRDAESAVRLADVLTRIPGREVEAIEAHRRVLQLDPTRQDSYRALRDLHLALHQEDGAWLASAALIVLGCETEADRTRFESRRQPALKLRRDTLPPDGFSQWFVDEAVDPNLVRVLHLLHRPLIAVVPFKTPGDLGLSEGDRVDMTQRGTFQNMAQACSRVFGIPLPPVFHARGRLGIAKVPLRPVALAVGDDVLTSWRGKELRFGLGRALTTFLPGLDLAGLVDARTLRLFLLAALRLAFPEWPLKGEDEVAAHLAEDLAGGMDPGNLEKVREVLTGFRQSRRALDPSAFLQGIDLTASRVGLFMANDLEVAGRQLKQDSLFVSDLEFGDRLVDLCAWSISARYADARRVMIQE